MHHFILASAPIETVPDNGAIILSI